MSRPDFLLTAPPEWTDELVSRRAGDDPVPLSLAYDPEAITVPDSVHIVEHVPSASVQPVRSPQATVKTVKAETGKTETTTETTTTGTTTTGTTTTDTTTAETTQTETKTSVQPVSVQPVSVQPVSVQPVSVQPVSVQPVSVTPGSGKTAVRTAPSVAALFDRVAADLAKGAWLVRPRRNGKTSKNGKGANGTLRLGGPTYELRLQIRESWEGSGRPGAVVTEISADASPPAKADRFPAVVEFSPAADEPTCDLDEVAKLLERRRAERRRLRRQLSRAAGPQRELAVHAQLRDEMRRRYGGLGHLLAGLEPRPRDRVEGAVAGTESGRGGWRLVVDCPGGGAARFRRRRVRVAGPDGTGFVARVAAARDDQLKVVLPAGWTAPQGSEVTVELARPAGTRHDPLALDDLLAGRVEGSWEDLARLLYDPGSLELRTALQMPATFYSDDDPDAPALNGDQRRAVAGAVSTPHAFFVQGPPGTGTSTVIGETVRQLIGRGERVLLLAPSPDAFAVMLRGVRHDPAVRPLVVAGDGEHVDERLHGYLPQAVGMADTLRRPAETGRAARWGRERTNTEHTQDRIDRLRPLARRYDEERAAADAAVRAAEDAKRLLARAKERAEETTATLVAAIAADEAALAEATAAGERAAAEAEAVRAELVPALGALRDAADEVIRAGDAAVEAAEAEQAAVAQFQQWDASHGEALRNMEVRRAALEQHPAEMRLRDAVQRARVTEAAVAQDDGGRGLGARLGRGESSRLRREHAEASAEVDHWLGELARRDSELSDLVAEHNRLAADAAAHDPMMRSEMERRQADRHRSDVRLTASVQALEQTLGILGVEISRPRPGYEMPPTWQDYGRLLHDWLVPAIRATGDHPPVPPELGVDGLTAVADRVRVASAEHRAAETRRRTAERDYQQHAGELDWHQQESETQIDWHAYRAAGAEEDAERRRRLKLEVAQRCTAAAAEMGYPHVPTLAELEAEERSARWRRHVVTHMPWLEQRWRALTEERTDEELPAELHSALVRSANLVCATTRGIVGPGGELVGHTDFDTMVVDDAQRVSESEFLAGAVHARRWVFVGDEHLPSGRSANDTQPDDEHLLHALTALHRLDRAADGPRPTTLAKAVQDLVPVWTEDPDERRERTRAVCALAAELDASGEWDDAGDRAPFAEAYAAFGLPDRANSDVPLLRAAVRYLGTSPFEAAVAAAPALCQPLVVQRRMIAPLARLVSEPMYRGRYQTPSADKLARAGVTPLVIDGRFDRPVTFLDTSDRDDAADRAVRFGGFVNPLEQDLIAELCQEYDDALAAAGGGAGTDPVSLSVLAFSRAQARALARRIRAMDLAVLRPDLVDVVDAADTRASDLVVVSFTRAGRDSVPDGFGAQLADARRLAAACTRARRALVLVGHGDTLERIAQDAAGEDETAEAFFANLRELADADADFRHVRVPG